MKRFLVLVIAAIFIVPIASIIPMPAQKLWYGQYLALLLMMFVGIDLFIWKFNKFLAIFMGICLLSSFFLVKISPRAILLLFQLHLAALASYMISRFDGRQRRKIVYAIAGLVVLQSVWLIVQYYNLDPIFKSLEDKSKCELVGSLGAPNQIGAFFALTLPVMLYIHPALSIISIIGIIVSKSTFALIAGICGGLLYLFYINRRIFKIAFLSTFILTAVFFRYIDPIDSGDMIRLKVWKHIVKSSVEGKIKITKGGKNLQVIANPIFGYGFGNFIGIFPYVPQELVVHFNYMDEKWTHAHNDPLEILFDLGYLGFGVLVCLVLGVVITFVRLEKSKELVLYSSCLLVYLVDCSGNFLSHLAYSGMLLILSFGMFNGVLREQNVER